MAKKIKREVSVLPKKEVFMPIGRNEETKDVILTLDEFEAIRLVDYEGFSQELCGEQMNVSRATAQRIHRSARNKMAVALVEGCSLRIEGGNYKLNKK